MITNLQSRLFSVMPRKMKVNHMSYTQIPPWLKKQDRDPFDYQLRSKAEVQEDQKYFPPDFQWIMQFDKYPSGDTREHVSQRIDHRDKKAKIFFDMRDMNLSPEQRERLIFLLGRRYEEKDGHQFKIVYRDFKTYQANYIRAMEIFREIYWEAIRAPSRCITMDRNPYRREQLTKKFYGKTAEERKANRKLYAR